MMITEIVKFDFISWKQAKRIKTISYNSSFSQNCVKKIAQSLGLIIPRLIRFGSLVEKVAPE